MPHTQCGVTETAFLRNAARQLSRLWQSAWVKKYVVAIDNHDSLSFLKPMYQVAIVDELPEWDYPDVKAIRNCFIDTDLYPDIDSILRFKREDAIEEMMKDLDDYFALENQYIESIRQYSLAQVDEYIYYISDTITEICRYKTEKNGFAKVFNHKHGDFMSLTKFAFNT